MHRDARRPMMAVMDPHRLGLCLPADSDRQRITTLTRRAEDLGMHSVWVTEHTPGRDPFVHAAAAAMVSDRLRIGRCFCVVAAKPGAAHKRGTAHLMITGGGRFRTGWAQAGRSARRLAEPLGRVSGGEAGDAMVSAQPTLERAPPNRSDSRSWQRRGARGRPRSRQSPEPSHWMSRHRVASPRRGPYGVTNPQGDAR